MMKMLTTQLNSKNKEKKDNNDNCYILKLPYYVLRALLFELPIDSLQGMILTCKSIERIVQNEGFCLQICLKWWANQFPTSIPVALPINKNWRWLLRCIMNPINEKQRTEITEIVPVNYHFKEKNHLYLGEFGSGGTKNGAGIFYQAPENQLFTGYFVNNKKQGFGKEIHSSGEYYEGDWCNDLQNGNGVKMFQVGKYEGQWKDNQRQGFGCFSWTSGSQYKGHWEKDQKQGFGVYKWKTGDKYKGFWKKGVYDYGNYSCQFGSQYIGEHNSEGKFEGNGSFVHPDGHSWIGNWKNGLPTDIDACVHPKLKKCLHQRSCSRTVTKKDPYYGQVLYKCNCSDIPVCKTCASRCHQGHTFQDVFWTVGRTFCQCTCNDS